MIPDADFILGNRPALIDTIYLTKAQYDELVLALRRVDGVKLARNDAPLGAEPGSWRESFTGAGYHLQVSGPPSGSTDLIVVTGDCPQWRVCAVRYIQEAAASAARQGNEVSLAFVLVAHLRSSIHAEVRAAATAAYEAITASKD